MYVFNNCRNELLLIIVTGPSCFLATIWYIMRYHTINIRPLLYEYVSLLRKRPLNLGKISVGDFPFPHKLVYYERLSNESTSKTE